MLLVPSIPLIILGSAILFALRQAYGLRQAVGQDWIVMLLTITGWIMIFTGIQHIVTPFAMPIVLILFAMAVAKFREGERRSLLWTLSLAAEKGLPLAPSARAFAARRSDEMARRAEQMADFLDAGYSLPDALRSSGNPLPVDAKLMVRLGANSQAQSVALRESAEVGDADDEAWRPVFEQTLYLTVVMLASLVITAFVMIKIVPSFRMIFDDFGAELPPVSQHMISAGNWLGSSWFLFIPLVIYLIGMLMVSVFFYARGQIWIPWPLSKIFGRSDNPAILRGIAVCLEQGMPIADALQRVGDEFPKLGPSQRVRAAAHSSLMGRDWCEVLYDEAVVTKAEMAVLRSATKTDNLPWAMREIAALANRRMVYRAKTMLAILSPICLVLLSLPVGLLSFGCIAPLVSLINGLSHV